AAEIPSRTEIGGPGSEVVTRSTGGNNGVGPGELSPGLGTGGQTDGLAWFRTCHGDGRRPSLRHLFAQVDDRGGRGHGGQRGEFWRKVAPIQALDDEIPV